MLKQMWIILYYGSHAGHLTCCILPSTNDPRKYWGLGTSKLRSSSKEERSWEITSVLPGFLLMQNRRDNNMSCICIEESPSPRPHPNMLNSFCLFYSSILNTSPYYSFKMCLIISVIILIIMV